MANTIKLKRGTSTPSTSDIASGEVAVDTSAQKLYINDSGTVKEIGGGGGISFDSDGNLVGGTQAGNALTSSADHNIILGYEAGNRVSNHDKNVYIGFMAGQEELGGWNVAIGSQALYNGGDGDNNVAIGNIAVGNANNGENNVGIGTSAIKGVYSASISNNVGIGYGAGTLIASNNNTLVGYQAAAALSTGGNNTILGADAGDALTTGSNNLILGHDAAASAVGVDNEITLGDTNVTKFRVPGLNFSIKDSTATDNYVLTVDSNGDAGWEAVPSSSDNTKLPLTGGTLTGALSGTTFSGTHSSGNIGLEIHGTGSGIGAQAKFHNDHGVCYVGVAGDTSGDMMVYNEANTALKFFTNGGSPRLTIAAGGAATFSGSVTATGGFSGSGASLTALNASNISSGTIAAARVATLNQNTTGTAALATSVTVTANNGNNENVFLAFVDSSAGGTQGIETDGALSYNPSTNALTTTEFIGGLTGNASGSSGSCTGNAATATALATARTIAGVSFDGSANISLNNNAITNGAGYITSADGGNAATLDGIDSTSFLRSDANDTMSGELTFTTSNSYPIDINGASNAKIVLRGSSQPYIKFRQGSTDKAYIQWGNDGYFYIVNQQEGDYLMVGGGASGLKWHRDGELHTLWTSGNDGAGSGLDADLWDGNQFSSYLNQGVTTGSAPTFTDIYANDWFRNNNSTEGIYNQSTTQHFYSDNDDYWNVAGGSGANGIRFRDEHGGTIRGYIYADNSNNCGILSAAGNWGVKVVSGAHVSLYHNNSQKFYTQSDKCVVAGHFYPESNNSYDLGHSSYRWRHVYTGDLSLSNEGSSNDVDGTWGSFTIQEGENDLFLFNKRNGKRYKFNLTEVS